MPNERKSTRLAKATMKASLESGDDMDDSDSEFDEDELLNKNQGPAVKRKASGKTSTRSSKKQPPKKKFKGMRGLLSNVVDMPMDILFEVSIFGQRKDATYIPVLRPWGHADFWQPLAH